MAPTGSYYSVISSRLEPPTVKRSAATKLKGPSYQSQSNERAQEELQALRAEVLMLRQHLDASESPCKCQLETCCQSQEARAQAKQLPSWEASQTKGSPEIDGNRHDGSRGQGEASMSGMDERGKGGAEMETQLEEKGDETEVEMVATALEQAPGEMPSLAEEEDCTTTHTLANGEANHDRKIAPEGDVEILREEIQALTTGKAEAEAQASLAWQKLQSLQATLGKQTERLAEAMETQSCHVEKLLTESEEKDRLVQRLNEELEESKKALGLASAECQRLRALLRGHRGSEATEIPVEEESQGQHRKDQENTGLAGPLQEEKMELEKQQKESVLRDFQESKDLHKGLECPEACQWGKGDGSNTVDVLQAAQKRELWLQGSRQDAQTQTEGPYGGLRHRELVSVAFDDTQYEPYGLPEVVMKGFADIPQGPSCPYVLRRGILGSAPIAQLAPKAEPEEDFPDLEEGTGV